MASNRKFSVPINLLSLASNPASADEGDVYYNTTDDRVRVYKNSAWVNLAYADDVGITSIDYITFDTTPEASSTETGTIFWDSGDGLPKVILNANVELGLGQEQVALCKNATGSSIPKGSVVYINGAAGQRPTIALADADTEATSSKTFGLTAQTIADGAEGFVATFGVLRGVNTNGLTEGAAVWLSSTAGGYTTTIPAEPAHAVFIGYIVKAHASSGEILINIQNGYELNELHGVLVDATPADNEVLAYDSTSTLWINQTAAEAGLATSSHNHTLDSLSNVTISSNSSGEILKWNGTAWINNTLSEAGIQPLDTELTAIAGLTSAADRLPYFTGSGTASLATFTSFGRSLVDDADASAARTTLGLGTMAVETASNYLTTSTASSTYLPLSAATANQIIYKNASNVASGSSGLIYDGTHLKVTGNIESRYSSGDEGGELILNKPVTNTTITDGVVIDVHQNKLRIFEQGGTNRGVYIDITAASAGVGTNLVSGGSASNSFTTIATTSGTSPVADSSTDTLTLSAGTGITVTGDSTTDTVTIAVASNTYQPLDSELTAIAGLTSAADRLPYFTGSGTAALATFTSFGRSLVDDADASTGRTTLGGTTVGSNLFTLTNPSAITFLRVNADNTVSTLSASDFRTAIGAGTSSTTGTVTSITAGTGLSGGTITTSGTIALSHLGIQSLTDPNADRIMFWDDSAGAMQWLTLGTNLSISGTTLNATDTNTTYSAATSTVLGLVELFSDTVQSVAANTVSSTASRTYGIQVNASGQMVVNVPWTDTDTNTTYTAGTGLQLTTNQFSIDSTVATLTGTQTLTNKTLSDSTTFIANVTDSTKKFDFNVSQVTTGTTVTMWVGGGTAPASGMVSGDIWIPNA